MRTTISLDDDVAAAVERLRAERGLGLSETVNDLVRRGLSTRTPARTSSTLPTAAIGLRIDVSNVSDALEVLEGPSAP